MITPTQWNRVSELFASALELDGDGSVKLLQQEEESVRAEVERLLREHQRSGLLDRGIAPTGAEEDHWTGKSFHGRYWIERFLARCGAGAVYLARDGQIAGRAVVVKFLERQDPRG